MNTINTLIDISSVAAGLYNSRYRTGIYRYSIELAKALAAHQKIGLSFWLERNQYLIHELNHDFMRQKLNIANAMSPISIEGQIVDLALRINYKHHFLPTKRYSELRNFSKVYKCNKKVDIYHSFFAPFSASNIKHRQRILTIHDIIALIHPKFFTNVHIRSFELIFNSINRKRDHIITVSHSTKNDVCERLNIPENRVHVTHLAANKSIFWKNSGDDFIQLNERYGLCKKEYLLSLATVEPRKNYERTLKAFSNLKKDPHFKDLKLVLVGNLGWKYENIIKTLNDHNVSDDIIFTNYIEDSLLSSLYSNAVAFLYPSLYEGFGLPILEAMQCGCPVITSNTSSMPEIVEDSGILINPYNVDEITDAIKELCMNSSLNERLSTESIQKALNFSWDRCAYETINCYKAIL